MAKLTNDELVKKLTDKFSDKVKSVTEPFGLLTFITEREDILAILGFLKTELQFVHLTDIAAVHYPELPKPFEVVYHVHSLANGIRVRIKVYLPAHDVHIPTATTVWNGANWMERETFDFFGVVFDGHPDLRRILNVDDMTVFPMRREYPLEDPNRIDKKDYFFGR